MASDAVEIPTEPLVLWMPTPDAAAALLEFHVENEAHLRRWSPAAAPGWDALVYWERRLRDAWDDAAAGRSLRLVVSRKGDLGRAILGTISLTEIVRGPLQQAYLGYALGAPHQGKGIMLEAVRALCAYAFDTLRLHRVCANYMPSNDRSAKVLRACGFVPIGFAQDYLYIDGAWRDHVMTALVDPQNRPPP